MYIATINMNKNRMFVLRYVSNFEKYCCLKVLSEKQTKGLPSSVLCLVFVSLVSHENIEIFVVIHEKAIQRSLKYEKETRTPEKSFHLNRRERDKSGQFPVLNAG